MRFAVLLAVAGVGLLCAMDAAIKLLAGRYPVFEVAFFRFAAGGIVASLVVAVVRPPLPGMEAVKAHGLRACVVVCTATSFFYALAALPLAEAVALSFLSPLILAVLGVVMLKERFSTRIGITLAIGLSGMLVIVAGRFGGVGAFAGAELGVAAVLLSAFSYAFSLILLRQRATRDPLVVIVWFQNVLPALLLAVPALLVWQVPAPEDLAIFAAIGVTGVAGHALLTAAFARAQAAFLAPIEYTALVWGSLWGFLFFQEIPGPATLLGAALIVAGTLYGQGGKVAAPRAAEAK